MWSWLFVIILSDFLSDEYLIFSSLISFLPVLIIFRLLSSLHFSSSITSHHIMSYYIVSCHIISCHVILYHMIWYDMISYHILSHIISNHIISYYIITYHIISYYIISYHILFCFILYFIVSYNLYSAIFRGLIAVDTDKETNKEGVNYTELGRRYDLGPGSIQSAIARACAEVSTERTIFRRDCTVFCWSAVCLVLCCVVLCCVVLCCVVLCCVVLCVLSCLVLCCVVLCCVVIYFFSMGFSLNVRCVQTAVYLQLSAFPYCMVVLRTYFTSACKITSI